MARNFKKQIRDFGKIILELRTSQSLTQPELAELCGVHKRTIRRIENGEFAPSMETMLALAKVFKLQPSQLLERIKLKLD